MIHLPTERNGLIENHLDYSGVDNLATFYVQVFGEEYLVCRYQGSIWNERSWKELLKKKSYWIPLKINLSTKLLNEYLELAKS